MGLQSALFGYSIEGVEAEVYYEATESLQLAQLVVLG
jgi:hypothetical protein